MSDKAYWWIAGDDGQDAAECLRKYLPFAAAKLGAEPTTILCNPADVDVIKGAFAGLTIDPRATIPANNFWIGAGNGARKPQEGGENGY